MIDKFEHLEDVEETRVLFYCRGCNEEFEADFDLLMPRHVEYEMASNMRMTVTCPHCGVAASTDQQEYKLICLRNAEETISEKLSMIMSDHDIRFKLVSPGGVDVKRLTAKFECLGCGAEFEARSRKHPDGATNVEYATNGDCTITCPECGSSDEINAEKAQVAAIAAALHVALAEVKNDIKKLAPEEEE